MHGSTCIFWAILTPFSLKAFPKRNIAFLQYKNRSGAEFAKIAMADQNVGGNSLEVINVRWATDDPNPKHIEMIKRKTQVGLGRTVALPSFSLPAPSQPWTHATKQNTLQTKRNCQ